MHAYILSYKNFKIRENTKNSNYKIENNKNQWQRYNYLKIWIKQVNIKKNIWNKNRWNKLIIYKEKNKQGFRAGEVFQRDGPWMQSTCAMPQWSLFTYSVVNLVFCQVWFRN